MFNLFPERHFVHRLRRKYDGKWSRKQNKMQITFRKHDMASATIHIYANALFQKEKCYVLQNKTIVNVSVLSDIPDRSNGLRSGHQSPTQHNKHRSQE